MRPDAIAAWKAQELTKRNEARASEILVQIKGGKSLEAVATERGMTLENTPGVTRQGGIGLPTSAVEQVFAGPLGHKGSAAEGNRQVVFEVVAVIDPDFDASGAQVSALRQSLSNNAEADLLNQLSAESLKELGYTINEPLLQQAINHAN